MIVWNLEAEMPPSRQPSRIDITELKAQIVKKLGPGRAERYFRHLNRFVSLRLRKSDFDKLCFSTIGRQNVTLHNQFIRSILKNACQCKIPPFPSNPFRPMHDSQSFGIVNRYRKTPQSPSPVNGYAATTGSNPCDLERPQQESIADLITADGRTALVEVVSVEDGEEVEQEKGRPNVWSRSPLGAPLGIHSSVRRSLLCNGLAASFLLPTSEACKTCRDSWELPDFSSLRKRIGRKLDPEGLVGVQVDFVNLLNSGLDAFLKRLIKPCMEVAGARHIYEPARQVTGKLVGPGNNSVWPGRCSVMLRNAYAIELMQRPKYCFSASLLDFRVAMELSPQLLGEDWPVQLEKICLRASEE